MTRILGPCRCQGCGALVFYDGISWVHASGDRHNCRISSRFRASLVRRKAA